jgi:hypothetical protein
MARRTSCDKILGCLSLVRTLNPFKSTNWVADQPEVNLWAKFPRSVGPKLAPAFLLLLFYFLRAPASNHQILPFIRLSVSICTLT